MSRATVEQILTMIDGLATEDRELLERRLGERLEAEWRREAAAARREATVRGVDQAAIDAAVRKHRYGS